MIRKKATVEEIFLGYLTLLLHYPRSIICANNYWKRVDTALHALINNRSNDYIIFPLFSGIQTEKEKKEALTKKMKDMYRIIIKIAFPDTTITDSQNKTETTLKKLLDELIKADPNNIEKAKKNLEKAPEATILARVFTEMVNDKQHIEVEQKQYLAYTK
jgi:hypothetical protein